MGDYVEVTRCHDCLHYSDGYCQRISELDDSMAYAVDSDDYCSRAERRDAQ